MLDALPPSLHPLLDLPRAQVAHSPYLFVHKPLTLTLTTTLIILVPLPSTMVSFRRIQVCALLLVVDPSLASHTLVRRAVSTLHQKAVQQTHSLAQDLRMAFGGIIVPRADASEPRHVVYCRPGRQRPLGPSGSGSGTGNSSTTVSSSSVGGGSTSRRPAPTTTKGGVTPSPSASSPWKLIDSHVR